MHTYVCIKGKPQFHCFGFVKVTPVSDGWQCPVNDRSPYTVAQPWRVGERYWAHVTLVGESKSVSLPDKHPLSGQQAILVPTHRRRHYTVFRHQLVHVVTVADGTPYL